MYRGIFLTCHSGWIYLSNITVNIVWRLNWVFYQLSMSLLHTRSLWRRYLDRPVCWYHDLIRIWVWWGFTYTHVSLVIAFAFLCNTTLGFHFWQYLLCLDAVASASLGSRSIQHRIVTRWLVLNYGFDRWDWGFSLSIINTFSSDCFVTALYILLRSLWMIHLGSHWLKFLKFLSIGYTYTWIEFSEAILP